MTYIRLSTGDIWKQPAGGGGAGVANNTAAKFKYFPYNKIIAHITGVNDGADSTAVLYFSTNSGESFGSAVSLPANCTGVIDVAEAPDGSIWGLFADGNAPGGGPYTARCAVSINQGTSWTVKYSHLAGHQAFNIATSPVRGAETKIAFTTRNAQGSPGADGSAYGVVVSIDSGDTWAFRAISMRAPLSTDADSPLIQWQQDRLIIWLPGTVNLESEIAGIYEIFDPGAQVWYTVLDDLDQWSTPVEVLPGEFASQTAFGLRGRGSKRFLFNSTGGPGQDYKLNRSMDSGWTWTILSFRGFNLDIAIDDRLWAYEHDDGLYVSDDDGSSFVLNNGTTERISAITCHQTDANRIAFITAPIGSPDLKVYVSTNSGQTWASPTTISRTASGWEFLSLAEWAADGSLLVAGSDGLNTRIWRSINDGASFTQVYSAPDAANTTPLPPVAGRLWLGAEAALDGSVWFCKRAQIGGAGGPAGFVVARSLDHGATWSEIGVGTGSSGGEIAVHLDRNKLYVGNSSGIWILPDARTAFSGWYNIEWPDPTATGLGLRRVKL